MLKEYNRLFLVSQVAVDGLLVSSGWWISHRMVENKVLDTGDSPVSLNFGDGGLLFGLNIQKDVLDLSLLSQAHIFAVLAILYCLSVAGMYRSFRNTASLEDIKAILKGLVFFLIPVWFITELSPSLNIPTGFIPLFISMTWLIMSLFRFSERQVLKYLRARGFNQRHLLIVGAGRNAQNLVNRIGRCQWMGFKVVGYITQESSRVGKTFMGTEVLGVIEDLPEILATKKIDQVYCALSNDKAHLIKNVSEVLEQYTVDFRVVPDLGGMSTLHNTFFEIDGVPVLGIRETPMQGFGNVQKRLFDVVVSLLILVFISPIFLLLALLVKLSSKGPVFYRQKRVGYDGRIFHILKFRSMGVDAEDGSGAVWAVKGDDRTTKLGSFMRKTSLDELPQFFNVLMGHMSVVGPRPERPEFIKDFREELPRYMLRHKIKAGITGWAQVNGWRGQTSLKKRLQYDLYYIDNWSIWFDVRIVLDTIVRGFMDKNAY
ncbi:MAG: undecaprenyl-phosphate glucose phosphotransferase [Planctomycetes bacterium]|nr:undecaprenyl-phosphate glucose phosphotransferase [Planctomycetota bacterium]